MYIVDGGRTNYTMIVAIHEDGCLGVHSSNVEGWVVCRRAEWTLYRIKESYFSHGC